MKKILIPILCVVLSMQSFASGVPKAVSYHYEDVNTTVTFDCNSSFTEEEQAIIAERLVFGSPESESSTYALCWLTGHNLSTETVTVIDHKVDTVAPRCLETLYEVESCSKCDYFEQTEVRHYYIDCCPEE